MARKKPIKSQRKVETTGFNFRKNDVDRIMSTWNAIENLPKVRGTDLLKSHIIGCLKRNKALDVINAIMRYGTIINDNSYFFDYKWTLQGFVSKRDIIPKFTDGGTLWVAYMDRKNHLQLSVDRQDAKAEFVKEQDKPILLIKSYKESLQHLKEIPYDDYLQTEHWLYFVKRVRKYFNNKCCVCDDSNQILDVHHKTYENRGREMYDDVVLLCRTCHAKVHNKV